MCQAINQQLVEEMEKRLRQNFPSADFEITDSEDGMHLQIKISSSIFKNKPLIQQHKMVYAALDDLIKSGELHSINIKTSASERLN